MQWDVTVNHTHQSIAEARKSTYTQRKLAFLVFQEKQCILLCFTYFQTLSVLAQITCISIFSVAPYKHCTSVKKINSNVSFPCLPLRFFKTKSLFAWLTGVANSLSPSPDSFLFHLTLPFRWAAGEENRGKSWQSEGDGRELVNMILKYKKKTTANQMCLQKKKKVVSTFNVPFNTDSGTAAEGILWNSRI